MDWAHALLENQYFVDGALTWSLPEIFQSLKNYLAIAKAANKGMPKKGIPHF